MAEARFNYASRDEMHDKARDDLHQRAEEIVGPGVGGLLDLGLSGPSHGWTEEEINVFFREKSHEEIDVLFAEADRTAVDYDEEALAALQQEEIDLAVANLECARI